MTDYCVDRTKWAKMSIFEQMGNIYSEVGRSLKAKKINDDALFDAALIRTLDLFNATTEMLIQQKSPRAKEVLRARDQFLSLLFSNKDINSDEAKSLDKYFLSFAIAARRDR